MSRRMSCSLTIDAVKKRTKTVTRRHVDTWRDLEPGDHLTLIEKGMGLAKGEKQVVLAEVEVVDVRVEQLGLIDFAELRAEGFPHLSPYGFWSMWTESHGYGRRLFSHQMRSVPCRRIEWRYL